MNLNSGRTFGQAADVYERGRPTYPPDAVAWLLGGASRDVIDVGAGTGKLTAVIEAAGHRVIAVDPDPLMLASLSERLPHVAVAEGSAEHLPVPTASADAVVLGQAWHWVDVARASAELDRVVRPGGVVGLLWNIRDGSLPWVARITEAMGGSRAEQMIADHAVDVAAPWEITASHTWRWSVETTEDGLLAMAHSRSRYLDADEALRAQIDAMVADAVAEAAASADDDGVIVLPYVTHAFRAERRTSSGHSRPEG